MHLIYFAPSWVTLFSYPPSCGEKQINIPQQQIAASLFNNQFKLGLLSKRLIRCMLYERFIEMTKLRRCLTMLAAFQPWTEDTTGSQILWK